MKKTFLIIALVATTASALVGCSDTNQESLQEQAVSSENRETLDNVSTVAQQDTIKGSIPSEAAGSIGDVNIKISYYAPGVKGRIIWGGLVPYDQVWTTGAHMATSLEFEHDLVIGGQEIQAGKYALFTNPGREEWTVIINKNWEQHLADEYDQKEDVLRVKVKPTVQNQHQERLKYEIKQLSEKKGAIHMAWDDLIVSVPVSIQP
ncbi:hypothetical protein GCM10023188_15370 [Pontibacter saemangeumensis]|uniref:DUF2911 domain-containing protein n=1 Tax=Pontibacter saemangeumensis TaxID=1084525 RepID=A0ABP8LJV2_9BACT